MKFRKIITEAPMEFGGHKFDYTDQEFSDRTTSNRKNEIIVLNRATATPENLAAFRRRVNLASSNVPNMPVLVTWKVSSPIEHSSNISGDLVKKILNRHFPDWEKYHDELRKKYGSRVIVHYIDKGSDQNDYPTIDFMWIHRLGHIWIETHHIELFNKFKTKQENMFEDFYLDVCYETSLGMISLYIPILLPIAQKTKSNFWKDTYEHVFDMFVRYYKYGRIKFNKKDIDAFLERIKDNGTFESEQQRDEILKKAIDHVLELQEFYDRSFEIFFTQLKANDGATYYLAY